MSENKAPDFYAIAQRMFDRLPSEVATTALNHFKRSFEKQGFMDANFQAWPSRKNDNRVGGAILVQTGNLRDSTRIAEATMQNITIENRAAYAEIHNKGGVLRVRITPKSRKYFWYMYKLTADTKWKWMALSKKQHFLFRMPKRQFMGESANLNQRIDRIMIHRIIKNFK